MHTTYSDGSGSYSDIANAALNADLDAIIITDHNVLVGGVEKYFENNGRQLLMLVGEEIHDPYRMPQKNHLLVFGSNRELAAFAPNPQNLINQVKMDGGLCFLAHPDETALPLFNEGDFSWESWEVRGYTGIELWNGLSEFKAVIHNRLQAVFYAFFPEFIARGPEEATLKKWDELTSAGDRVVAIGGTDAHCLKFHLGLLKKTIFPYEFHFRTVNTHLITPGLLSGDLAGDRKMIYDAMRAGHGFIGYDIPSSTRGFRFTAQGRDENGIMGDILHLDGGATLQIHNPGRCECLLLKNGNIVDQWSDRETCTYIASEPGVYRVECYINFLGKRRGWIFSNPIYLRK